MIALFASAALAGTFGLTGHVGVETSVSDPILVRRGLRLGASADVGELVSVDLSAGLYPVLGVGDETALTRSLHTIGVSPDLSRELWDGRASVVAWPLRVQTSKFCSRLGVEVGAAAVRTRDDLHSLQVSSAPNVDEVHLGYTIGVLGDFSTTGPVGGRVRIERLAYDEHILADVTERKDPLYLGIDVVFREHAHAKAPPDAPVAPDSLDE